MKKAISILLALTVMVGMTAMAYAANPKITTQISALADVDAGEVGPGHQIWIPLKAEAFEYASEALTMSDVKTSKIAVKQSVKSGSKAISSVEIKEGSNKAANILITLVDPFTSTKAVDFETNVYLTIDGKKQGFTTVVSGTLQNYELEIDANTEYVDLSSGDTASCVETTSGKVEAYLGNGVSVFTRMTKGKQYYGTATLGPDADDDELMGEYPDIYEVVTINAINLSASGQIVKIDGDQIGNQNFYVYDSGLDYLGRTNDMLPYSEKYYLSESKLDILSDGVEEPEDPENSDAEKDPGEILDGEETYPAVAPSGNNPDTGLPPLFTASFMAGGISLATIVGVKPRKKNKD